MDPQGQDQSERESRCGVVSPCGPAAHHEKIGEQKESRHDHGVLLGQKSQGEQGKREGVEARASCTEPPWSAGLAGAQEGEDGTEGAGRRQKLRPPHDLSQGLGVHRVDGE